MCDFYMGGYKVIVQFKGSVRSRSGSYDYKFGKLGMGWVFSVQIDKKTDRQTNRQKNRKIDRENDRKRGRENGRHTDRWAERQTRQTIRQASKKTV